MVGNPSVMARVNNDSLGSIRQCITTSRKITNGCGIQSVLNLTLTFQKRQASMNGNCTSLWIIPVPTVESHNRLTMPLSLSNPLQHLQTNHLSHLKQFMNLQHSGAQKHVLRETFDHEDMR